MPSRTVLVTGGAGYVGSHACKALKREGYHPVVYDNLIRGHREFVRWGPFEEGDILDVKRLEAVVIRHEPRILMHFAACASVEESVLNPQAYYLNNVAGTINVIETARKTGIRGLVFSSSCSVYGVPEMIPITEDHPRNPVSPYGRTKFMAEKILEDAGRAYGLTGVSLRYFNAAGADPELEIGEDHNPETHLIPKILDVAAGASERLIIHGTDYETADGTCVRDYVHVADLADAHVLSIEALEKGIPSDAFNLGNERGYSVAEVITAAEKITGRIIPRASGARRAGDPPVLSADIRKAKAVLGWQPRFGDIEKIIHDAWEWRRHRRM